jgi:hypothetical protein
LGWIGEASSTHLCRAAPYAALLRSANCLTAIAPTQHGFWTLDGPRNENIENNPMQSSMVRPFERSRKNILTRRANHRHIFIVATIKPAPENPPRAF